MASACHTPFGVRHLSDAPPLTLRRTNIVNTLRIGTAHDNDIVLTDDPRIAPYHVVITQGPEGYFAQACNDDFPLRIDDIPTKAGPIAIGQELGLGDQRLPFSSELASRLGLTTEAVARTQAMAAVAADDPSSQRCSHTLSLGAHPDNDVVIDAPQVSGKHATITFDQHRFVITDLHSRNGTFVNGHRIATPTDIHPGDLLAFGSYAFTFDRNITQRFEVSRATLAIDIGPRLTQSSRSEALGAPLRLRIGRAPDNDLVISAPQVSAYHAEVWQEQGQWRLRDLGSTNGTFLNQREERLTPHTPHPLGLSDILFLGSYRLPLSRVIEHRAERNEQKSIVLSAHKERLTLGRAPENDIVLDSPTVSRHHAELVRQHQGWVLRDLHSANGTFVNGERITERPINTDEPISLGSYVIRIDPEAGRVHREYQGEIMLCAEGISVTVPDTRAPGHALTILDDVSFTAYPTEVIGIMGPSGAGKTTLLMALNGYLLPTRGQSLINNLDLYRHYNSFRGNIGYVPQDDIIHKELTVYESLYYTARLRLPPDTGKDEIVQRIDAILDELGIADARDVIIGSPLVKGISGGQRKRVNLAQELLTQPSLLFLDEPTSGLASSDTRSVMALLRRLANAGRSVILTIHQPSLEVYQDMDNVLYLARGKLVYYGPAFPDAITFFNPQLDPDSPEGRQALSTPDSAMAPLAADNVGPEALTKLDHRREHYRASKYHRAYVEERRDGQSTVQLRASQKEKLERRFGLRQWWTLTCRNTLIKRKDRTNLLILLLQAPIIGIIIAAVFGFANTQVPSPNDTLSPFFDFMGNHAQEGVHAAAIFMLVASAVWFGTSNSAREIVAELAIYRRERMVNLKIPSYVLAKFAVLAALSLIQCAVLLGIVHPLIGLSGPFPLMLLLLTLCAWAGLGIGLSLSAMVRSTEAAVALVPLLLIPQLVLGGLIVPLADFDDGIAPATVRTVSGLMVARWAFEALLHTEDAHRPPPPPPHITPAERESAKTYWDIPYQPSRTRFAGHRHVSQERQELTSTFVKVHIADTLTRQQKERSLAQRYFGEHQVGWWASVAIQLAYIALLLLAVCVLLRRKDLKVS